MSLNVTVENLDWLEQYWQAHPTELVWEPLFVLPSWLRVWHRNFAPNEKPTIITVKRDGKVIGIAPLIVGNQTARIIGSPNVCDYEDIITAPGEEVAFSNALLDYSKRTGVTSLDLGVIRPDSKIMSSFVPAARNAGATVTLEPDEVTLEKDLPPAWEDYLESLDAKQRHELKRKLRRLEEYGKVSYRIIGQPADVPSFMDVFENHHDPTRAQHDPYLVGIISAVDTFLCSQEVPEVDLGNEGQLGETPEAPAETDESLSMAADAGVPAFLEQCFPGLSDAERLEVLETLQTEYIHVLPLVQLGLAAVAPFSGLNSKASQEKK